MISLEISLNFSLTLVLSKRLMINWTHYFNSSSPCLSLPIMSVKVGPGWPLNLIASPPSSFPPPSLSAAFLSCVRAMSCVWAMLLPQASARDFAVLLSSFFPLLIPAYFGSSVSVQKKLFPIFLAGETLFSLASLHCGFAFIWLFGWHLPSSLDLSCCSGQGSGLVWFRILVNTFFPHSLGVHVSMCVHLMNWWTDEWMNEDRDENHHRNLQLHWEICIYKNKKWQMQTLVTQ